jgi:predicted phosphodiesterase
MAWRIHDERKTMNLPSHIQNFDDAHQCALRKLWFLGDVHGEFKWLARSLMNTHELPTHVVFLGDVDIDHRPFREILVPLRKAFPTVTIAFIHGNHDCDSYEAWECLHDGGAGTLALHGKVTELNGIRIAGLGGAFMGRVWSPPDLPKFASKESAMNRGAFQFRGGQRPSPNYLAAIYPDDYRNLSLLNADILITHEAPSCHRHGWEALDLLGMDMKVIRHFHGHTHDDQTDIYRKTIVDRGFDAVAVPFCGIKNGLGEAIFSGAANY